VPASRDASSCAPLCVLTCVCSLVCAPLCVLVRAERLSEVASIRSIIKANAVSADASTHSFYDYLRMKAMATGGEMPPEPVSAPGARQYTPPTSMVRTVRPLNAGINLKVTVALQSPSSASTGSVVGSTRSSASDAGRRAAGFMGSPSLVGAGAGGAGDGSVRPSSGASPTQPWSRLRGVGTSDSPLGEGGASGGPRFLTHDDMVAYDSAPDTVGLASGGGASAEAAPGPPASGSSVPPAATAGGSVGGGEAFPVPSSALVPGPEHEGAGPSSGTASPAPAPAPAPAVAEVLASDRMPKLSPSSSQGSGAVGPSSSPSGIAVSIPLPPLHASSPPYRPAGAVGLGSAVPFPPFSPVKTSDRTSDRGRTAPLAMSVQVQPIQQVLSPTTVVPTGQMKPGKTQLLSAATSRMGLPQFSMNPSTGLPSPTVVEGECRSCV
jgi:hypothetical protein